MSDEERLAVFVRAVARYKAGHWRPGTPEENAANTLRKLGLLTRGEHPLQRGLDYSWRERSTSTAP